MTFIYTLPLIYVKKSIIDIRNLSTSNSKGRIKSHSNGSCYSICNGYKILSRSK